MPLGDIQRYAITKKCGTVLKKSLVRNWILLCSCSLLFSNFYLKTKSFFKYLKYMLARVF